MFPDLSPHRRGSAGSMSRLLFAVLRRGFMVAVSAVIACTVVFVELLGAVRTFEFMAFAGDSKEGNGHHEQGKTFHRGAS
jgi:hypothetical protein